MTYSLQHPQLSSITGIKADDKGVVQYLGIQYATLAHRFSAPEIKTKYGATIDATSRGPPVVRPPLACDIEFGLIQKALVKPEYAPMSDFNGLNLDITVPEIADYSKTKFPVLVFIHGGAFVLGDSGAPHYDMAAIVAYSQHIGKPIIGVSINYRLGVAGFLDSKELRATGIPANRGILDQKTAFQWLHRNISGFSGDPTRITALGQSAGGSSIMHLLDLESSGDALFDRAICLSGNNLAVPSYPIHIAQKAYKDVLQSLGIDSILSNEDQVAALIDSPPEDIVSKVPLSTPLGPVIESNHLPSFQSIEDCLVSSQRKPLLMIGSTDFDAVVFEVLGLFTDREEGSVAQEFITCLTGTIPEMHRVKVRRLLDLYGISESDSDDESREKILQFGTDLKYFASSKHYATFWPAPSWLYYFNESNPWNGPHQGRSAHCLDIAYLFLNYHGVMNESQKETAMDFARDVINFATGEAPWSEFHSSGDIRVYGSNEESLRTRRAKSDIPRPLVGPAEEVQNLWKEIGLDSLTWGWESFSARS